MILEVQIQNFGARAKSRRTRVKVFILKKFQGTQLWKSAWSFLLLYIREQKNWHTEKRIFVFDERPPKKHLCVYGESESKHEKCTFWCVSFFHHLNQHGPLTNGLKYFRFS